MTEESEIKEVILEIPLFSYFDLAWGKLRANREQKLEVAKELLELFKSDPDVDNALLEDFRFSIIMSEDAQNKNDFKPTPLSPSNGIRKGNKTPEVVT